MPMAFLCHRNVSPRSELFIKLYMETRKGVMNADFCSEDRKAYAASIIIFEIVEETAKNIIQDKTL